jgi:hypothetical protein
MPLTFASLHSPQRAWTRVGVAAGLAAGAVYLVLQVLNASLYMEGTGSEPLQRIGAMLLGGDEAPPPGDWGSRAIGVALLIHLSLSIGYGSLIDALVGCLSGGVAAAVAGAVVGVLIYIVNYWIIAPSAFPWFEDSRNVLTMANHIVFGVVAALVCTHLRARLDRAFQ